MILKDGMCWHLARCYSDMIELNHLYTVVLIYDIVAQYILSKSNAAISQSASLTRSDPHQAWNVLLLKWWIWRSAYSWQGYGMCSLWSFVLFFNAPLPPDFLPLSSWHMPHGWLCVCRPRSLLPNNHRGNVIIQHLSDGQIELRLSDIREIPLLFFILTLVLFYCNCSFFKIWISSLSADEMMKHSWL